MWHFERIIVARQIDIHSVLKSYIFKYNLILEYMRKELAYPPSGYEELDATQNDHYHRITPSPGECYGQ